MEALELVLIAGAFISHPLIFCTLIKNVDKEPNPHSFRPSLGRVFFWFVLIFESVLELIVLYLLLSLTPKENPLIFLIFSLYMVKQAYFHCFKEAIK